MSIPVGVIGASGFVGGELLRLLAGHPEFVTEYVSASGRSSDTPSLSTVHPHLRGGEGDTELADLKLVKTAASEAARRCAAVFLATPPEVSVALAPALLAAGVDVVVDMSPAFRIREPRLHQRWYREVRRPDELTAVYGLPELNRDALTQASLIAVPGCLATAAILALLPLCDSGVRFSSINIDGKSGSTGSGNRVRQSGMHAVRSGVVAPYAPVDHRHSAEVRQVLGERGQPGLRIGMSVYGVDLVRGLSVSVYAMVERDRPTDGISGTTALTAHFRDSYRKESFVRVRDWRREAVPLPDPKTVIGSNFCDIAAFHDTDADRFVVVSALDNLMKGAAGQAIQACNIRYGLPEQSGLAALPIYPA